MKTSCLIRNILLAGSISLTLASCGGGGGGGGESSSSDNNSATNTPSTQKGYAPYNLSGCTMTYNYDGYPCTFTFDASGNVKGIKAMGGLTTKYEGSYTYSRSSDGSRATLYMNTSSEPGSSGLTYTQTFDVKLVFSSATKATAQVSYTNKEWYNGNELPNDEELDFTTTATFSGSGIQDSGSSDGESNDDTTSDDSTQLAPESLPVGSVVNLTSSSGSKTSYTLSSATNCVSGSGSKLTWEYTCTGETTADFIARNALNLPSTYKLVFTTADSGTYTYINAGGEATLSGTFNLSDKTDAPTQGDSDDDVDDSGESNVELGAAPDSLKGYSIQVYDKKGFCRTFYFSVNGDVYANVTYSTNYATYTGKLYGGVSYYIPKDDRKSAKVKFYVNDGYIGPGYYAGETVEGILIFDDYGNIKEIWGTWTDARGAHEINYSRSNGSKL